MQSEQSLFQVRRPYQDQNVNRKSSHPKKRELDQTISLRPNAFCKWLLLSDLLAGHCQEENEPYAQAHAFHLRMIEFDLLFLLLRYAQRK